MGEGLKKRRVIYLTDEEWAATAKLAFNYGDSRSGVIATLVMTNEDAHAVPEATMPKLTPTPARTFTPVPKPSSKKR